MLLECTSISQVRSEIRERKLRRESILFIPTMGALHAGHISLIAEAKRHAVKERSCVVVSIFVNPMQFGPSEDLSTYPSTLEKDREALIAAGVDVLFLPGKETMYPERSGVVHVEPSGLDQSLEALARPAFFRGVATVVTKLFNIVQPDKVYFGQKDAGQCVLIRSMVEDLNMPIDVVVVETMREEDGLAMSSRNAYLSIKERKVAHVLFDALLCGKRKFDEGSTDPAEISKAVRQALDLEPMVSEVDYVSLASPIDMKEIIGKDARVPEGAILSVAIKLGQVRLIDNFLLGGTWTNM